MPVEPAPSRTKHSPALAGEIATDRLYRQLADRLAEQIAEGRHAVGDRLPAERELAAEHAVSRQTVREALIALEVQGLVEVRVGSGTYVVAPGVGRQPDFHVTGFELIEARMAAEGEAAALAADTITGDELDELDRLVDAIAAENRRDDGREDADRAFHLTIAGASRNRALVSVVDHLWAMRSGSPETALLLAKARAAKVKPVVEEHRRIVAALRSGDRRASREAMRGHLKAVLDHLLFAMEEQALEEVRLRAERVRLRFAVLAG